MAVWRHVADYLEAFVLLPLGRYEEASFMAKIRTQVDGMHGVWVPGLERDTWNIECALCRAHVQRMLRRKMRLSAPFVRVELRSHCEAPFRLLLILSDESDLCDG